MATASLLTFEGIVFTVFWESQVQNTSVKLRLLQLHLQIHHLQLASEILTSKNGDCTLKYPLYILKAK